MINFEGEAKEDDHEADQPSDRVDAQAADGDSCQDYSSDPAQDEANG
jgi:hypothetical protein